MQSHYLKFQIPYTIIREYLQVGNYKNIIFHVDLPSISRGFYNKNVVDLELEQRIANPEKLPTLFFTEAKEFFKRLYTQFGQYNPRFLIFYDNGECAQNKSIFNGYKDRSSSIDQLMLDDNRAELFKQIKSYYYAEFVNRFTIPNVSKVIFMKKYEADFTPWIMLVNNLWNCSSADTLNVILSVDKDLLQCCQFRNVIQVFTLYSVKSSKLMFNVYNDETAIEQIYAKFQRGILTSKYIPLMLALGGDKADEIPGINRVGGANAYKLIINHNLPHQITKNTPLPKELEPHRDLILRNYRLISFEEQLSRIPLTTLTELKNRILS